MKQDQEGTTELICGSMFSGKTEELIRRVKRAMYAKQAVQVFKPEIDSSYTIKHVATHNGQQIEAIPVEKAQDIFEKLNDGTTVVAIDEVQFFDLEIVGVIDKLLKMGLRVILAGLDLDFRGEPFGEVMPELMCRIEDVVKLRAICVVCGKKASRSQRLVNGKPAYCDDLIIRVGAQGSYEARCREHHKVPRRE